MDEPSWLHVHRTAMACRFEITLPAETPDAVRAATIALDGIDRLEAQLSVFRDTSEVSAINRDAGRRSVVVEPRLFGLLRQCATLHRDTDGAFDITTAPLTRCWGFMKRQGRVPDAETLAQARANVGMTAVALDDAARTIRFTRPGIELNLGAIGKGYALDVVADDLRRRGPAALLNAGSSSMVAIGRPAGLRRENAASAAQDDDNGWKLGIRDPRRRDMRAAVLALHDCAMATSGVGEQAFEVDGRRYSHLLDPRTGQPVEGVLSVTVIASTGAEAEALSTAFAVGGVAVAERYCATHADVLAFIFLEDDERPVTIGMHPGCQVHATRA
jgi:thiamine biosynthesis lipoprotein